VRYRLADWEVTVRRVLGYLLFTLGLTLVLLGPLMRYYVLPRVEKAPNDIYNVSISEGVGRYFSIGQGLLYVGPTEVRNTSVSRGDPDASEAAGIEAGEPHQVSVIDRFSRTEDLNAGDIDFGQIRYVMNRRTGEAIDCCGADPPQEGNTLKFPFNVERDGQYTFWDSFTERAWPAVYQRDEVVEGLDTYVFTVDVPPTKTDDLNIPGALVGQPGVSLQADQMYTATYTLWVETYTGAIINGGQVLDQWAQDPSTGTRLIRLAHLALVNTPETVANTAKTVTDKLFQLNLVKNVLPFWGILIGVALALIGLVLVRPRRHRPAPTGGVPETG
jgi:hypothetical protein